MQSCRRAGLRIRRAAEEYFVGRAFRPAARHPMASDVIIIGGGHNGLVAAAYLAQAGMKPLLLERRGEVGGCAATSEIAPGFRVPALAHATGPLRASVARDLRLAAHGLALVETPTDTCILHPDGRPLVLPHDVRAASDAIRPFSAADADAYPAFLDSIARIAAVIGTLMSAPPPSIQQPSARDLWTLLGAGRRFRALGKRDGYRLLRWGPMAVADLVAEGFETERLRAAFAARGVFGTNFGPWSAGSGLVLLLDAANRALGMPGRIVKGGPGALAAALRAAATSAGADIRTDAVVERILIEGGAARGVVLESGEAITAETVVSAVDPKRTFLQLTDPTALAPDFRRRIVNYRAEGTVAKINLALSALPAFTGVAASAAPRALAGRIHIGPEIDYLERAFDHSKYGRASTHPWLELAIPSMLDPSLAPPGAHVMSVYASYAPARLRGTTWDDERAAFGDSVMRVLERYAPGVGALVVARQVITPLDMEREWGLTGGHVLHGEPSLDQLFTMRPVLGQAAYRTPVAGLYLCSAGTHPGGGLTGAPGQLAARTVLRDRRS